VYLHLMQDSETIWVMMCDVNVSKSSAFLQLIRYFTRLAS
jgi:hypothetical protein